MSLPMPTPDEAFAFYKRFVEGVDDPDGAAPPIVLYGSPKLGGVATMVIADLPPVQHGLQVALRAMLNNPSIIEELGRPDFLITLSESWVQANPDTNDDTPDLSEQRKVDPTVREAVLICAASPSTQYFSTTLFSRDLYGNVDWAQDGPQLLEGGQMQGGIPDLILGAVR